MKQPNKDIIACPKCGETKQCVQIGQTQKNGIEADEDLTFIDNLGVGTLYYCHTCGSDFITYGNTVYSAPRQSYCQKIKEKFLRILSKLL